MNPSPQSLLTLVSLVVLLCCTGCYTKLDLLKECKLDQWEKIASLVADNNRLERERVDLAFKVGTLRQLLLQCELQRPLTIPEEPTKPWPSH